MNIFDLRCYKSTKLKCDILISNEVYLLKFFLILLKYYKYLNEKNIRHLSFKNNKKKILYEFFAFKILLIDILINLCLKLLYYIFVLKFFGNFFLFCKK